MPKNSKNDSMKKELTSNLESALNELQCIWDSIGFSQQQRQERTSVVFEHLCNLLQQMVAEEGELKDKLVKKVKNYEASLISLGQDLSVPKYEPRKDVTLLQLEKDLRSKVEELTKIKNDRLKTLNVLQTAEQKLCDVLCATPYYIPSGSVPTPTQLDELQQHTAMLKAEKEKRVVVFRETKQKIVALLEELEECPNTSFERDMLCEEDECFQLSPDNMKAIQNLHKELEQKQKDNFSLAAELRDRLNVLWIRLETAEEERAQFSSMHTGFKPAVIQSLREEIARCELLKFENMKKFVDGARKELVEWWDKCFYSPQQRDEFRPFTCTEYTEDLLDLHESELRKLKAYYDTYKTLLDRLNKRQVLWLEYLEIDRRQSDPNRFTNRGGNLLAEEKKRKKMLKDLPRLEEELCDLINRWEEENEKEFLVEGQRFNIYVKHQWANYKVQKENEKAQRKNLRARITEEEMYWGSKPTPSKRRFLGTPGKTPNSKMRKLNETKTPGSVSRINHTSLFASPAVGRAPKAPSAVNKSKLKRKSLSKGSRRLRPSTESQRKFMLMDKSNNTTSGVSSNGDSTHMSTMSISSGLSYQDFTNGLNTKERPYCRSSVLHHGQSTHSRVTGL
ncbi:protein regulator of cytokinesis 1-like [Tubulanus polymorphus]|uniref:protein regulator of cytokinesis 1-like n=1 Tax=Tubulanus polymorphus TaxID=672921 RepID=UPI003DA2882B